MLQSLSLSAWTQICTLFLDKELLIVFALGIVQYQIWVTITCWICNSTCKSMKILLLRIDKSVSPMEENLYSHTPICLLLLYVQTVKGSVSQILRWVLLYINRKLSFRPIIASNKIVKLLKGQFTIYIKQAGAALFYDMDSSRQY